ncbi:MAG: hypothetical protein Q9174_005992, partial [Haloplaca sp. 1 TL-2023]
TKSTLQSELNKVESFYNSQIDALHNEYESLFQGLNQDIVKFRGPNHMTCQSRDSQLRECLHTLVPLYKLFQDLHLFGNLNLRAFRKLGRECYADTLLPYMNGEYKTALRRCNFATQLNIMALCQKLGDFLTLVEKARIRNQSISNSKNPISSSGARDDLASLLKELAIIHTPDECTRFHAHESETALHTAILQNQPNVLDRILSSGNSSALLDSMQAVNGRTPLIVACMEGHEPAVCLLLEHGANVFLSDQAGWTAKDHAAYRGFLPICRLIDTANEHRRSGFGDSPRKTVEKTALRNNENVAAAASVAPWKTFDAPTNPVQARGRILVNIGVSNTRSNTNAVTLDLSPWHRGSEAREQAGLELEIDVIEGLGLRHRRVLPTLQDLTNEPIIFSSTRPIDASIVLRLFRMTDYGIQTRDLLGSGVAILKTIHQCLGSKHDTLIRDHTIPILAKDTLKVIASVVCNFMIVTPFTNTQELPPHLSDTCGFWRQGGQTTIVGHRGSGANTKTRTSLQIGENTIQSFLSARVSGATCVEFDVQLTKDLVPVIYHDFVSMDTGGDVPLHNLTYKQFASFTRHETSGGGRSGHLSRSRGLPAIAVDEKRVRKRSSSADPTMEDGREEVYRRFKYTEEGLANNIKGNLRGFSIQEPSTTLEELLTQLPIDVAFNLEMSMYPPFSPPPPKSQPTQSSAEYPMLWETEDRNMDPYALELNLFVDTILTMVYRLGGNRNITFSSFCPEICISLALKQSHYPILFISKAGSVPTGDVRASSLQQAVHFAEAWGLAGIVILSDVFVMCPGLIGYAKSRGLVCGSYGDLNDEPENAKIQAEAGLDALIVNKVRLIGQTLAKMGE